MLELDVPLAISALWVFIPVPERVQDTGTVMLISSTTLVLSSAETRELERAKPERRVRLVRDRVVKIKAVVVFVLVTVLVLGVSFI